MSEDEKCRHVCVAVAQAVRCAVRHHLSEQDGQHCRTLPRGAESLSVGKDEAGHRRHSHRCVHCCCVGSRDLTCQTLPHKIILVAIFIYSSRG